MRPWRLRWLPGPPSFGAAPPRRHATALLDPLAVLVLIPLAFFALLILLAGLVLPVVLTLLILAVTLLLLLVRLLLLAGVFLLLRTAGLVVLVDVVLVAHRSSFRL